MATVTNPTDNTLKVTIRGNTYVVGPKETIQNVPEQDAKDWKENTHSFIDVGPDLGAVASKSKDEPQEAVVVEEVSATIEEAPAPSRRRVAKK